jgi:indole-3-glycerol phosphate synthase
MDILQKIAEDKRIEVQSLKGLFSIEDLPRASGVSVPHYSFKSALSSGTGAKIIAELKRQSPSRGEFTGFFDLESRARQYKEGGAAALSVLTDKQYFGGDPTYVARAKQVAELPALYKDFIIDPYQLHFAKAMGADAVLLIARLLTRHALEEYIKLAGSLGLDCLVETHTAPEIEIALDCGAQIVGVNFRDLSDFSVSLKSAESLAKLIPDGVLRVAESGIAGPADISQLRQSGYSAFLVGEALMKTADPTALLRSMVAA